MKSLLILNARCAKTQEPLDIFIQEGIISQIGKIDAAALDCETYDAQGALLLPGLFDLHAHLGQPGHEARETIRTGSEAAIQGGVTGLLLIGNTEPKIDSVAMLHLVRELCSESRIPIEIGACITKNGEGDQQSSYGSLAAKGVQWLSDGDQTPQNPLLLRRAMQYAAEMGVTFALRGDIAELTEKGKMDESATSFALGLPSIPACAEKMGVFQIMSIAEDAGAPLHIQTLSTKGALEAYSMLKGRGQFTAEVALHHLIFDRTAVGDFDTTMKVIPPLRSEEDKEALIAGLNDGTIDCIVSDHTPCTKFEKLQDFCSAPEGMITLDTFLPALYTYLVKPGKLSWETLVRVTSTNPRQILGLPAISFDEGSPANFVLFQPQAETTVSTDWLKSKAQNSPWINQTLEGKVMLVCCGDILKAE